MRGGLVPAAAAALMLLPALPAGADDLTGARKFLCSVVQVTVCRPAEECETGQPARWNVPDFIEVDLDAGTLSTTKASGEDRSTPFRVSAEEGDLIFLQGVEAGRGFTFAIHRKTGALSAGVAAEGRTVAGFGACTPLAPSR